MRRPLVLALHLFPALLVAHRAAAQAAHTVSPGMSKAQVLSALGAPVTVRSVSDYTYIFYKNACGKQCGMNDLIVLHADSVVDAIFRSPDRHYTGISSSPAQIPAKVARRMKPGPANDTRPSIPLNPPAVRPAPPTKPPSTPALKP